MTAYTTGNAHSMEHADRVVVELVSAQNVLRTAMADIGRAPYKVAPNASVFSEGEEWDRVLLVLDGWLQTSKSFDDGEVQILDFLLPGDVVDPVSADGKSAAFSCEAITAASIVSLPRRSWDDMLKASPDLEDAYDHIVAASHARNGERALRLGKGTASVRVAYTLLEMCMRMRAAGLSGVECAFHLPLSQRHIGDFCGLSSVHVCRTLRRMVRHGIIETSDHIDVRILDVDRLAKEAKVDAAWLRREIVPGAA